MIIINNVEELDEFIFDNSSKIILLYFGASWCGPCKRLKQKLNEQATIDSIPLLSVCYIDIDLPDVQDLVSRYEITSLPTQIFIKLDDLKVNILERLTGYDMIKLKLLYDKYCLQN
jgi:thiol-disulfide isomerase/thioredoxin